MPEVLAAATIERDDIAGLPMRIPRRYADPACWFLADAVDAALDERPGLRERVLAAPDAVGVIAVSAVATRHTMRLVAAEAERVAMSPTRFAAASPGTLTGIVCALFGLRGPGAMLTVSPATGCGIADIVADGWLDGMSPSASYVLSMTYAHEGVHRATCRILAPAHGRTR